MSKRDPDLCETEGCEYLAEPKSYHCWLCQVHIAVKPFQNPSMHDLIAARKTLKRLERVR
jgi:hypothetical protein